MGIVQAPVFMAIGTALAGVVLFGLAPHLPSLFPASFTRLVGFGCVCAALVALWMLYESWLPPALLGGASVAAMVVIHFAQTRRRPEPTPEERGDE